MADLRTVYCLIVLGIMLTFGAPLTVTWVKLDVFKQADHKVML